MLRRTPPTSRPDRPRQADVPRPTVRPRVRGPGVSLRGTSVVPTVPLLGPPTPDLVPLGRGARRRLTRRRLIRRRLTRRRLTRR